MISTNFLTSCKRFILIPFLLIAFIRTTDLCAQTTSTTTNPNWTDNNDWDGNAPNYDMNESATLAHNSTISQDIKVNSGVVLIINAGVTLITDKVITIKPGGTLIINGTITGTDGGKEFKIEDGGTLVINSGGFLDWAGKWDSDKEGASVTIDGTVIVGGEFKNKTDITGSGNIMIEGELKNNSPGSIFGCTDTGAACCPSGSCILPIDLISFYGVPRNNDIVIYWSTASELNNDFFTVERSKDGIQWDNIYITDGAGNSNTILIYEFTDTNPPIGLVYYRLRQTDYDGAYSYSDLIVVNSLLSNESIISYPNPAQDIFLVEMKDIQDREVLVSNSVGQQFYLPVKKYVNKIELDVTGLKGGMYFVKILDHSSQGKISFIKKP